MDKKQSEIAVKLGVTQAAVSQYLKGKRGYFVFPEKIQKKIMQASRTIVEGEGSEFAIMIELCKICKFIQKEEIWDEFKKKCIRKKEI